MRFNYLIPLFLATSLTTLGQGTINGTVMNKDGKPLQNALVYAQNSFLGTTTNSNGVFELEVKTKNTVIVISYLGYEDLVDSLSVDGMISNEYTLRRSPFLADEFVVEATRADAQSPFAYQDVSKEKLEQVNLAQDIPILLNQTISSVTTSDAGAGVGYTGIRIRGSDATRINVTVNGVPLNDAESHGVFWVNMPDFASTTNNLQIQRGVGTSANGAGAFGASINLQTTDFDSTAFVEVNNSFGSFNTRRHNVIYNSGVISDYFNFEGRLSYIGSDGYIDRSSSDLRSYYFAGGYHREKFMAKAVIFSGREITQQAWYGTPESRLLGSDEDMISHALNNGYTSEQTENLLNSGRTYNHYLYENEVDNYGQDHYQLITGTQITPNLYLNLTGHYTRGKGYFEQSLENENYSSLGLSKPVIGADTLSSSDFIVRRWLDNHFYGGVYSLLYNQGALSLTLGGSYNEYIGDHYGEVIWSENTGDLEIRDRYYFSDSRKADLSNYIKAQYRVGDFSITGDVQYRYIDYRSNGVDNDQRAIAIAEVYNFLNPKAGVNWQSSSRTRIYASVARASREPVRNDFIDAIPDTFPRPEYLTDFELGWEQRSDKIVFSANAYFMYYEDQLVLTGEVNDVGAPVRTNVDESYRLGLELMANMEFTQHLYWQPNITVSQNRILEFDETIIDYTNGFDVVNVPHTNTDVAFSPPVIAGSQFGYKTEFGLHTAILTKYVSRQFLDNTSNPDRALNAYWTNDVLISYSHPTSWAKNIEATLLVNNILNQLYSSNGYTYSYIFGDLVTENFFYPQAGTNWLFGLKLRF